MVNGAQIHNRSPAALAVRGLSHTLCFRDKSWIGLPSLLHCFSFAELTLKREFLGLSFKLPSPIGARNYILIYTYTNQQVWLYRNQLERKIWINQSYAIWTNQNYVCAFPIGIKIDQLGTSVRTFSVKGRLPLFCLFREEHFQFLQFATYSCE